MKKVLFGAAICAAALSTGCTRGYTTNSVSRTYHRDGYHATRTGGNTGTTTNSSTAGGNSGGNVGGGNHSAIGTRGTGGNSMTARNRRNTATGSGTASVQAPQATQGRLANSATRAANRYTARPWGKAKAHNAKLPRSGNHTINPSPYDNKLDTAYDYVPMPGQTR